jgi:hypothetical protein
MPKHFLRGMSVTVGLLALVGLESIAAQAPTPARTPLATVAVSAALPWVDTGLTVHKGDHLSFEATGTIHWGSDEDQVAGPEGHGAKPGKLGAGGLIGRIGTTGKPFAVGNVHGPVTMPQAGRLYLGINDFIFKDNTGQFTVQIF